MFPPHASLHLKMKFEGVPCTSMAAIPYHLESTRPDKVLPTNESNGVGVILDVSRSVDTFMLLMDLVEDRVVQLQSPLRILIRDLSLIFFVLLTPRFVKHDLTMRNIHDN